METADWNAETYHRVSAPQLRWGLEVMSELKLRGDETVVDAGCGTGRLTAELLARLPRGRVIAVDASRQMLDEARAHLEPRFNGRITFIGSDLLELDLPETAE